MALSHDSARPPGSGLPRAAAPPLEAPPDTSLDGRRRAVAELQALRNGDAARDLQRDLLQHGGAHSRFALALPHGLALTHGRRIAYSPRLAANADDRGPDLPLQRLEPRHLRGVDDLAACHSAVRAELSELNLDPSRRGASLCHVRRRSGLCSAPDDTWALKAFCFVGAWVCCCPCMCLVDRVRAELRDPSGAGGPARPSESPHGAGRRA